MAASDANSSSGQAGANGAGKDEVANEVVADILAALERDHGVTYSAAIETLCHEIGEESVIAYVREGISKKPPICYWKSERFRNFVVKTVLREIVRKAGGPSKADPSRMRVAAKDVMGADRTRAECKQMLDDVHDGAKWNTPVCGLGVGKEVRSDGAGSSDG